MDIVQVRLCMLIALIENLLFYMLKFQAIDMHEVDAIDELKFV